MTKEEYNKFHQTLLERDDEEEKQSIYKWQNLSSWENISDCNIETLDGKVLHHLCL